MVYYLVRPGDQAEVQASAPVPAQAPAQAPAPVPSNRRQSIVIGQRGEWLKRGRPVIQVVRVISHKLVLARLPDDTEVVVNCRNIRWFDQDVTSSSTAATAAMPASLEETQNSSASASAVEPCGAPSVSSGINHTAAVAAPTPAVAAPSEPAPLSVTCAGDGKLEVRMHMHESDLECVVCYEPLVGKVFQCMLGAHNICQNCRDSIRSSGKDVCPMDRTSGGFIPNPRLEKEIATLTKPCRHSACSVKLFPWKMDAHLQACEFGPFSCPLCQKQVSAAADASSNEASYFHQHLQSGQCVSQYQPLKDFLSTNGIKLNLVPAACYCEIDPFNYLLFSPVPLNGTSSTQALYEVRALCLSLQPPKGLDAFKLEYMTRNDKRVTTRSSIEVFCWQRCSPPQSGVCSALLALPNLDTSVKVVRSALGKFQIGDQLDALDTRNLWLEAEVVDINPDIGQIYIHYTGWSQRWDIWISEDSERIGPFRRHTTGPTGPRLPIVPPSPQLVDAQPMRD